MSKNHRAGKPWATQYPRRADAGWQNSTLYGMAMRIHTQAVHLERLNADPGTDPMELFEASQGLGSLLQEWQDMHSERYVYTRDVEKANFVKAHKDEFIDPSSVLEAEEE